MIGAPTTGEPRLVTTGTRVTTTRIRVSWTPSRSRLIPATSTPTGLAPGTPDARARPTFPWAHRVPALSAACPAPRGRRARPARLRAIRRRSPAVPGLAPMMPSAARDRVLAARARDRKDRLASVRLIHPPRRTRRPLLETHRLPGLALPVPSPAGSASRSRPAPARIPQRVPTVSSKDSRARMVRRRSSNSLRAATRMGHPRPTDASPECQ